MNLIPSVSIPPWVKRVIWWVLSPKGGLIILLVVLFAAFVSVMFCKTAEGYIGQLLGLSGTEGIKNQILTFLGLSMGGILLALQAVIANTRAKAMENAANAQAKANENAEKGQRQERLKNAIEHLGHTSDSVRLGGAYELFHLAQDTEELHQRQSILDILCAHIRQTTNDKKYQEEHKSKPSEEIQSVLTLLFVQDHDVFKGLAINLQESWLNGCSLSSARLEKADLRRAYLQKSNLVFARLQRAELSWARMEGAELCDARLQQVSLYETRLDNADLYLAHLQGGHLAKSSLRGVVLGNAKLQGAELPSVQLQAAHLESVNLRGADLELAQMHGADLHNAMLQGAQLCGAQLQEAKLVGAQLQGVGHQTGGSSSFDACIRDCINLESDLSGIKFAGGLTQEDLDSFAAGLPDYIAKKLRSELQIHIGKPESHELPKDSGAITGNYTKEEAEQWIAEYKEAMSGVPEEGDS